ncbi:MAG: tRNA preQ1(34) S-adenosylmethionine ribosyltransferase-isomerase QueA [Pseudomonadota bacterium]
MRLSDFDFALPEELIALRPVRPRRAARMLVADGAATHDSRVEALPDWLRPGDLLVFNDTRVIPARLDGVRRRETANGSGEARIEVTLLKRLGPARWDAFARPAKRLRDGDRIAFGAGLTAIAGAPAEGRVTLDFDRAGPALDSAIAEAGAMPLPPYIASRRAPDVQDREDYQTAFARRDGSVAAPTASLHFDDVLLAALEAHGVLSARVTLHVGAGTFLPVKTDDVTRHVMHAERGAVSAEAAAAINAARDAGGRIIPVGTTALRLIESAADEKGRLHPFEDATQLFIRPGHRFRIADGLMTNFHLPRSTLVMLVAAMIGTERTHALYAHAIERRYRFYSYGDASLLLPDSPGKGT